jgi:hypothetical protein
MGKNLRKFEELGNQFWNTFHYCNFFQISTDFEIFQRFLVKFELTKMCSDKLNPNTITNPPELNFGQELIDMHTQYPKIKEDNEFPSC